MALAPLVSVEELTEWLRATPADIDAGWAELVLSSVSALVRNEAGQVWVDVPVPEEARAVAFTVAARVYRNPDAASQFSDTTGPFNQSRTFSNPAEAGLYLSPREKAILSRFRGTSRGLWTMATTRDEIAATAYVPTVDGPPFPFYAADGF